MSVTSISPQQKAANQARSIETFWARRGHPDVKCYVAVVDNDERGRPVFGVRSNIDLTRLGATPARAGRQ